MNTESDVPILSPRIEVVELSDAAKLAVYVYEGETCDPNLTPILMLHGNGSSHRAFQDIASVFGAERTVVVPDMRGQGISTRGTEHLTYELLAEDALSVLDALSIERASILGSSDGGIEALLLARDHQSRVAGIIAMGANLTPDGVEDDGSMAADEALYLTVADDFPAAKEQAELLRLMIDEPQIEATSLATITCPTTVMAGEFDIIHEDETKRIAASIPGAKLVIVPESGHSILRDAPEAVEAEVRAMLVKIDVA